MFYLLYLYKVIAGHGRQNQLDPLKFLSVSALLVKCKNVSLSVQKSVHVLIDTCAQPPSTNLNNLLSTYYYYIYSTFLAECPRSEDRMERFACPSPDFRGRYRCIDDRSLCDGFFDCPSREDENPEMCLFYKTVRRHRVHCCKMYKIFTF